MKSFIITLGTCLLLSAATRISAQEQTGKDESNEPKSKNRTITAKATVQDIDRAKREVTLKKEDGSSDTVKVPESAKNFDQLKVGDIVTARYSVAIAAAIRKPGEPPSPTGKDSISRSAPGENPGVTKTETKDFTATIENIDRDKRELTLKGAEGKTKTVEVPEDMKKFDSLKEGDQVVVTVTRSLALELNKAQE
jgi:hypothetical protein